MSANYFVHETAEVSPAAMVGASSKIWNHVQVREGVVIGSGCILSKNVYVDANVQIGDSVKIQNNVSVYQGVTIEDEVFVGPSVTFTNDYRPRALSESWNIVSTRVKTGASIGANATIVCGVDIGRFAMVAAGAVVTKDVGDHCLVAGNPAKPIAFIYKGGDRVSSEDFVGIEGGALVFQSSLSEERLLLDARSVRLLPRQKDGESK